MAQPTADTAFRERLERLVRAGVRISAERSLEGVLQEVADSAREVTAARYAALGVLNPGGTGLAQFVTSGLTPEQHKQIGAPPTGKGLLGLLIAEPKPIRLPKLGSHANAYGFPKHHPAMTSFLGVPVVGRRGPIGNLYLTDKVGTAEFSDEDEAIAVMLAAQAGVAVENARLYQESERLLNELRQLQSSRDRFFAMINHELRNALTAVFGWAELWVRKAGPEPPRAALEVHESAERTLGLLNDLLDLSRLDAERLELHLRDTDANHLAREAVRAVEPQGAERRVKIECAGPDKPIPCVTDQQRVRQILINLLTNAVRHTPDGTAVTLRLAADENFVEFDVTDRGPGIAAEQHAMIFEAFAQAGGNEHRGTGLGLTLSRHLATRLGGTLTLQSQVGKGAHFKLRIPRQGA